MKFPWTRDNKVHQTKLGPFLPPPMPTTNDYQILLKLLINAEDYHNSMPIVFELEALNTLESAISDYRRNLIKKQFFPKEQEDKRKEQFIAADPTTYSKANASKDTYIPKELHKEQEVHESDTTKINQGTGT